MSILSEQVKTILSGADWDYDIPKKKLFHISFNPNLPKTVTPRIPYGSDDSDVLLTKQDVIDCVNTRTKPTTECAPMRVSFSETFLGCFYGVYANVIHLLDTHPYLEFSVYEATNTNKTKWLSHRQLTSHRMVWDAHLTKEWVALSEVQLKRIGKIKFYLTDESENKKLYAYGDKTVLTKNKLAVPSRNKIKYEFTKS